MASNKADSGAPPVDICYFLAFTQLALNQKDLALESLAKARSLVKEEYVNGIPPEWSVQQRLKCRESEATSLFQPQ